MPYQSPWDRGIHLTLSDVADITLMVEFSGGCFGGAWIVWNSLVGSDGSDAPTMLLAMSLS